MWIRCISQAIVQTDARTAAVLDVKLARSAESLALPDGLQPCGEVTATTYAQPLCAADVIAADLPHVIAIVLLYAPPKLQESPSVAVNTPADTAKVVPSLIE